MIITVLTYKKDLCEVERHLLEHREYLDKHYSTGNFIASGAQNPRIGGVILMNTSKEKAYILIKEDPFFVNDIAEYSLIEFFPTKYDPYFELFTQELKKVSSCENMIDIRSNIDIIDNQIVSLVARRAEYVKAAAKFKKSEIEVQNRQRVEDVITSKRHLAEKYNISPELIETIYRNMIHYFINEEMEVWKKVNK